MSSQKVCSNVKALLHSRQNSFSNLYSFDDGQFYYPNGDLIAYTWQEFLTLSNIDTSKMGQNMMTDSWTKYAIGDNTNNCNEILGALVGGGIAASLSAVDAYGWSIPLGLVLGKGIANSEC